ncbi:MAG: hypothetical protein C0399_09925 [Syntrophus sp. (in: bacteria)]|nr:hypothetical protein [Syntrophus sp. (in: bacteria)]
MNKKIQNMAVLIEFIAGSGLAIFFHQVLRYPEAAYTIFGIGILLSLVTYLLRDDIGKTRGELLEQYHQAHELTFAVAQISDPECRSKAHELMASAMRSILLLQQGYIPMDETEFNLEGAKQMGQTVHHAKMVDRITTGWDSRGALHNFYQANLRAIERGVKITRIFVVTRENMAEPDFQKVLLAQYRSDIDVRIAFHDELPSTANISNRDTDSSFDFAIYDDRVITDVFSKPGKYFGRKTSEPMEVTKYLHLYELVEHSAYVVTMEDDKVILAGEIVSLGS